MSAFYDGAAWSSSDAIEPVAAAACAPITYRCSVIGSTTSAASGRVGSTRWISTSATTRPLVDRRRRAARRRVDRSTPHPGLTPTGLGPLPLAGEHRGVLGWCTRH